MACLLFFRILAYYHAGHQKHGRIQNFDMHCSKQSYAEYTYIVKIWMIAVLGVYPYLLIVIFDNLTSLTLQFKIRMRLDSGINLKIRFDSIIKIQQIIDVQMLA